MNDPACRLQPLQGMMCGPAAVCAVTGKCRSEVEDAIMKPAAEDGEHPSNFDSCSFRHLAMATVALGFELFDLNGQGKLARDIPRHEQITLDELNNRPAMADFLQNAVGNDIL